MGAKNSTIEKTSTTTTSIPKNTESLFSFKVDKVAACTEVPSLMTAEEVLKDSLQLTSKREDFSHRNNTEKAFVTGPIPGFLLALHTAFQSHYTLKLSASDFIILIGQGLGRHIDQNAEKLREYFVNHKEKEEIVVIRDEFVKGRQNDWSTVFGEFGDNIRSRVKSDIYDVVIDDTSVATPTSRIVSELTLMDCMKSYFDYTVVTRCGFPEVILEGTPDDWKKLQEKYNKLVEMNKEDCMGLDFWLKHLTPVIQKICETGITRKADASFWSNIYKYEGPAGSGSPHISGWCTVFFPYLAENTVNSFESPSQITTSAIPKQLCQVPFLWRYCGERIPMNFYGGFIGAHFDKTEKVVSPSYFWCVTYDEKRKITSQ